MENHQCIVVAGNPADGFRHYGPFPDSSSANGWADDAPALTNLSWWVCDLEARCKAKEANAVSSRTNQALVDAAKEAQELNSPV